MRNIAITTYIDSVKIIETRIDGVLTLPKFLRNNDFYRIIQNNYNQFAKDKGQNTYQIIDNKGGFLYAPALPNEYEIDGISVIDEEDLMSKFINLKPFGLSADSGSTGSLTDLLNEVKKITTGAEPILLTELTATLPLILNCVDYKSFSINVVSGAYKVTDAYANETLLNENSSSFGWSDISNLSGNFTFEEITSGTFEISMNKIV